MKPHAKALPFSRADIAVLPDAEQLRTAAASVERCWTDPLRERNEDMVARLPSAVLAAAAAEDRCWRALAPHTPRPNRDPAPTGTCANHDPAPSLN